MQAIREWIVAIAAASMIIAAAGALAPKNAAGKLVSFAGMAILTVVLLSPLKKLDMGEIAAYKTEYSWQVRQSTDEFGEKNEKIKRNIIARRTAAYILQRAEDIGASCDVTVACEDDIPYAAEISIKNEATKGKISKIIAEECGIPPERQTFKIAGV